MSSDIPTLENFIFADKKEDFLKKLVNGTQQYYYYTLTNLLNQKGGALSTEEHELLEQFKDVSYDESRGVELRYLLLKLKEATNETDRNKAIQEIRKFLSINDNHDRPIYATGQNLFGKEGDQQVSDTLDDNLFDVSKYLNSSELLAHYYEFSDEHLSKVNLSLISEWDPSDQMSYLNKIERVLPVIDGVPLIISNLFKNGQNFDNTLKYLTVKQFDETVKLSPNLLANEGFLPVYLCKTFNLSLKLAQRLEALQQPARIEEQKQILQNILAWVKNLPLKREKLEEFIIKYLLILGWQSNEYDFDLFLKFIKEPGLSHNFYNSQQKQVYNNRNVQQRDRNDSFEGEPLLVLLGLSASILSDQVLIDKYSHEYIFTQDKYDILEPYFEKQYLHKYLLKVRLQKGQEVAEITKNFQQDEIKKLTDKKLIKVARYNSKYFENEEEVKLEVVLKNIPQLTVKLFELNTENYYRKNKTSISQTIELDGLIASEETSFEFNEPPIKKFTQTFTFENIQKKHQGVFIIDFQGNGVTSRAIIQKGCLILKEKKTIAGHAFQILDQNLNVCKGTNTGIYFQRKFYPVNSDDEILIPYADSEVNEKAILIHENFSQLADVKILAETYSFKCAFLYNTQSMLMSSKAKILIQPRLYLNNEPAPLSLLKDTKVVVTSLSEMGISSSNAFSNIVLNHKEEIEIEFPVAPKLNYFTINVQTKVKAMTKEELVDQSATHQITFNQHKDEGGFCIQNLRLTKSGYEIYLLGQNGEPKSNITMALQFKLKEYSSYLETELKTNEQGFVKLNFLENVENVISQVKTEGGIEAQLQQWNIQNNNQIAYKDELTVTLNDTIHLPYLQSELNSNLRLMKALDFMGEILIVSIENNYLKVENNTILISPLPFGTYKLYIVDLEKEIRINVEEGTYWNNTSSIQTARGLIQQKQTPSILVIEDVVVETPQSKESGSTLTIKLKTDGNDLARVHVFAFHYLQNDVNNLSGSLNELITNSKSTFLNLTSAKSLNSYQNNKTIADEVRYALERKRQQRFIGNTLEKPHLLLKRTFVRDTTFEQEQLGQGGEYEASKEQNIQASYDEYGHPYYDRCMYQPSPSSNFIECYNNFLLYPSLLLSNLKPDENGNIVVPNLPLSNFSTIQIVATDLYNSISKIVPLEKQAIETRNLVQKVNPQKDKFFTISRTNEYILSGGEFKSNDFTSTEMHLVDSLAKLFAAQKELRKIEGGDTEQTNGYDFWDLLIKWQGYSLEEKNKKYDKFACHELNLYTFCKDPPFFLDFVVPFVKNKIEKTFIDRFLLSDEQYLLKAANVCEISKLNALELVLLILYLKQTGKEEEAKSIYNYLEQENKNQKYDTTHFKKLFDTVLNVKTEGEELPVDQIIAVQTFTTTNQQYGGANIYSNISPYQQAYPQQAFAPMMMQQQMVQQCMPQSRLLQRNAVLEKYVANYDLCDDFQGEEVVKYEEKRTGFVKQFQNTEKTKEYCERHYYSQTSLTNQKSLVPVNSFWVDLAKHILTHGMEKPFLSANFIYCAKNHTQMIAALSLLALPFEPKSHNYEAYEGKGIKISVSTNCIVFAKQIKEGKAQLREDILITQKMFDPDDRYVFSDENPDDKYEKQITEYIINKRYGCQVIVTNCSAARHELQVFVEIPSGSIPVTTNDYSKTHNISLDPFQTKPIEFFFYFPQKGDSETYPANVAKAGQIVAVAKKLEFEVKEKRTVSNLETLNEILQKGSQEDILNFVATKNILNRNIFVIEDIYYLLSDKNFYSKLIEILRSRKIFDFTVWGYSSVHNDYQGFVEYLNSEDIKEQLLAHFSYFDSDFLQISSNRFFEYSPLSNPRAHMLHQDKSNILNREFREKYQEFLKYLSQKSKWSVGDRLGLVYYFLLQDRIEEAIAQFNKIEIKDSSELVECQLQYDYFNSYIDLFVGFPNFYKARELCEKYLDYPVLSWRNLFYEIANKLAEYDGEEEQEGAASHDEEEKKKKSLKKNLKQKEELNEDLNVELSHQNIEISAQNISQLTIKYYLIDLEILFSRNPFFSKDKSDFGFVQPNLSQVVPVELTQELSKISIPLPEKFKNSNVSIEVSSQNTQKTATYFSTSLQTVTIQESGQIKVIDKNENSLSKVYVKTFAKKKNGEVLFHKDGYTDLVGRFDYGSRSAADITEIEKFSIFICSDELGSLIKEVQPPSQVGQIVEEVKLKGAQWNVRASDRNQHQVKSYANHQQHQMKCKNAFY